MLKACSAEDMRKTDRAASERGGIPSIVLMENAGIACVRRLEELGLCGKRVGIFCGKGNNGGDGFVIARHLINKGVETEIFTVCGNDYSGDALTNYNILRNMGVEISVIDEKEDLKYKILSFDIIVDAIFGTGISGEIRGTAKNVITAINRYAKFVLSVDIPSGVNADDGSLAGVAVKADETVTFCAYKYGMLLFPGADYCGKVRVEGISIPEYITAELNTNVTDRAYAEKIMPKRTNDSHKGSYGKVVIIGGSVGMTGAPTMAAEAAVRSGAGLVSVAVPKSLNGILEVKLTEAMTLPMPEDDGHFSKDAEAKILEAIKGADTVVFGPGIGRSADAGEILAAVLDNSDMPIIADADGLYALAERLELLERHGERLILTPHEAEFSRLCKKSIEEVHRNRIGLSADFCKKYKTTLVLKGAKTVVTAPDLTQYINITGNSGMATGGSGDVLSGMIGAFSARGMKNTDAAVLGVYCHGLAGDAAAERIGKDSLAATDIISAIHLILPVE